MLSSNFFQLSTPDFISSSVNSAAFSFSISKSCSKATPMNMTALKRSPFTGCQSPDSKEYRHLGVRKMKCMNDSNAGHDKDTKYFGNCLWRMLDIEHWQSRRGLECLELLCLTATSSLYQGYKGMFFPFQHQQGDLVTACLLPPTPL